jgi:uncharacterized SAM-binding protein YcdF (DUF218 family)
VLDYSICQQISTIRLWTFFSAALLFILARPLLLAAVVGAAVSWPWVFRRDRWKKPIIALGLLLFVFYLSFFSPLMSQWGENLLVKFLPADSGEVADAIVVLGRGEKQNPMRAQIAGNLWQAQRAPLIFISGRKDAPLIRDLIFQQFPKALVAGEPCSLTTDQNAAFTASLLRPRGINTIILVTDPAHMWRSLLTFESFGFRVIPYFSPLADDTQSGNKRFLVIREGVGLLSYGLMGRYKAREVPPVTVISGKTEPNKTEPNKTEPNKTEPNKTEPAKSNP